MTVQLVRGVLGQQNAADWTPAQLDGTTGLRWYDFTDESTISDTGGLIDSIADKFAGGYDLSGSGATRPTTGAATLNSLNVATFAADYLNGASAADWKFLHTTGTYVASMVVKCGTGSNPNAAYGLWGTGAASTATVGASLVFDDRASVPRNEQLLYFIGAGSAVVSINTLNDALPSNAWRIVTVVADPGNGTAASRAGVLVGRGRPRRSNTSTTAPSAANPSYVFQLGANGNNLFPLTGQIAEVVMSSSLTDRWRIEDYFNRKFDLVTPYAAQEFADQVTVAA